MDYAQSSSYSTPPISPHVLCPRALSPVLAVGSQPDADPLHRVVPESPPTIAIPPQAADSSSCATSFHSRSSSPARTGGLQCFVCGAALLADSAEQHINDCLDRPPSPHAAAAAPLVVVGDDSPLGGGGAGHSASPLACAVCGLLVSYFALRNLGAVGAPLGVLAGEVLHVLGVLVLARREIVRTRAEESAAAAGAAGA